LEEVQAVVLAAAIQGDEQCRGQLPMLLPGLEEPYRTIAAAMIPQLLGAEFIDQHTLRTELEGKRLTRRGADGKVEELGAAEAVGLLLNTPIQPGQPTAYLQVLHAQLDAKRRAEYRDRAAELAQQHGDNPQQLLQAVEILAADARSKAGGFMHASEALELIPYIQQLEQQQQGIKFTGLDSGFTILNEICNGLDTGLITVAAPPAVGKTTLAWQISQQVAQLNDVPVLFVSLEQSKKELRAKALARLSKIHAHHIARGRLHSNDPEQMAKVRQAANEYFAIGRNLTVIEGDDTTTIRTIADIAHAKMARDGARRRLVAVDYLQILPLSPEDAGRITTAKDRVDFNVSALRRLARRLDSPVIAVSAQNRAGYESKKLDSFKESGAIEYSSDIAAILTRDRQTTGSTGEMFRAMELTIRKNRNGQEGVVKFKFYPERAEFIENGRGELPHEAGE
jgi:replicative DNA helicase